MKFIDEEGKINEGTPVTDEQLASIDTLHQYLHHEVCSYGYHSLYSTPICEVAARKMVMKYGITVPDALLDEIPKPKAVEIVEEPAPTPVPEPKDMVDHF